VKFLTKSPVSAHIVDEAVVRSAEQMFGKFGVAEMKARLIGLDRAGGKAVFRCALGSVEKLRAALAMISQVNGQAAAAMVIRSSGTIRGLKVRIERPQR
jgi:RNase P/RNase MRP subunit POP5